MDALIRWPCAEKGLSRGIGSRWLSKDMRNALSFLTGVASNQLLPTSEVWENLMLARSGCLCWMVDFRRDVDLRGIVLNFDGAGVALRSQSLSS